MQNIPIKNSRISEITIEHLKSSHPIDRYYEAIIRIITEIEDLVDKKNDRDVALLFLDGGVLDKWIHLSALAYTIRPICREDYHYNDVQIGKNKVRIDEDMLLDVVRTRELLTRMSNLRNKFCELAEETARTYGGCSTHYKENKHGWCHTTVWNFIVNGYEDIIDKTEESTGSELDYLDRFQNGLYVLCYRIKYMIYDMQRNVDSISYLAKKKLKTICPKPAEYKKILEDGLRDYSQSNGRVLMEQLELATKHFKQKRSEPLSPDVWGNLMKEEDNFLRSVIDCEQPTLDTTIGEVLGYTDFEELKANAPLVRAILKASRDEKVFDLDLAAKEPINLFDVITPDNLYLFMKIVLRRNLIQCQMFPHMNEAYELWLDGEDADSVDGQESANAVPKSVKKVFTAGHTSDYVKNRLKDAIKMYCVNDVDYYLLELTLFDNDYIKKPNAHKDFITALMDWGVLTIGDKVKRSIISSMSSKKNVKGESKYQEWDKNDRDRQVCIKIAEMMR